MKAINPVRAALRERGLNVETAAARCGYCITYFAQATRVPSLMSGPMRDKLASVLGLDRRRLDTLVEGEDADNSEVTP